LIASTAPAHRRFWSSVPIAGATPLAAWRRWLRWHVPLPVALTITIISLPPTTLRIPPTSRTPTSGRLASAFASHATTLPGKRLILLIIFPIWLVDGLAWLRFPRALVISIL
jgi:hypothetical protein